MGTDDALADQRPIGAFLSISTRKNWFWRSFVRRRRPGSEVSRRRNFQVVPRPRQRHGLSRGWPAVTPYHADTTSAQECVIVSMS